MSEAALPSAAATPPAAPAKEETPFRRFVRSFIEDRLALFGLALFILIVLLAIAAPLIAPQNPYDLASVDVMDSRQPPGSVSGEGFTMWLGSDGVGRDLLSGILYGLRISLMVGAFSGILAATLGAAVGLIAAYAGGRTETAIMRLVDLQLSLPSVLVALILVAGLGKGVDLNAPTKPLTSLPDPAQTLSDAGSSVPGAGQAGSLVDTAVGAAGTVVGTDTGNSPLAGPTDTLTGLGDVVPELPSVPGVTDGSTDELPDVPGLTAGGPLEGLNEIAGLPDTTPLTGRDGPLPDLSGVARTAGLPDYSGLGGLPDVAGVVGGPSTGPTQVDLASKNTDGVAGTATVDSDTVSGTATGMDPDARYVSFFYGATSSATNNNPCILDGTNPLPGGQTVGEWEVDENGNGTLEAPNPSGNMYKLTGGTMSIRKVEHGFDKATAPPVNPLSYSLSSCGAMERISTADPVTDAVPKLPTANVPGTPYVSGPGLQG